MISQINENCIKSDFPPVMPWAEFAEWIRTEPEVVRGWVDKGYIPTVRIGRRRMVNVVQLVEELKEQDK